MKDRSDDPSHHERTLLPRSSMDVGEMFRGNPVIALTGISLGLAALYHWALLYQGFAYTFHLIISSICLGNTSFTKC